MRVLLAGGGTAGHINPALAIAEGVKKKWPTAEIAFVGNENSMEQRLVGAAGYPMYPMQIKGFRRSCSPSAISHTVGAFYRLATAPGRCKQIRADFKPDVVIGTGGYVSGPILQQAQKQGLHTLIHESNALPGVTNRILSRRADCTMVNFEEAIQRMDPAANCVQVGNPIRRAVLAQSRENARKQLGSGPEEVLVLSFGGSLGALRVNQAMVSLMEYSKRKMPWVRHIHGTGSRDYQMMQQLLKEKDIPVGKDRFDVREYINDMDVCLAACDLVISRAGALTISEIEAVGRASILIPYPYAAENHQYFNACVLERAGAARVIEEAALTDEALIEVVAKLAEEPGTLRCWGDAARRLAILDATDRIVAIIDKICN